MEEHERNPLPMAELIGSGFFDLEMSPEGMIIYRLSEDAEEINPQFFEVCKQAIAHELFEFARLGYIEYRFDDNLDLEYRYTAAGIEHLKSRGIQPD